MSRYSVLLSLASLAFALSIPSPPSSDQTVFASPNFKLGSSLPHPNPTHSFWTHSPGANPLAGEGSTGPLTDAADVCIIGAGLTGVSAAYHLARAVKNGRYPMPEDGERVRAVVFEARDFCSGATGRNGGNLTPGSFLHFRALSARFSPEDALRYFAIEDYSASEMARLTHEHAWAADVDLVEGGHIEVFLRDVQMRDAQRDWRAAREAGRDVDVRWLGKEEMNTTYGTPNRGIRTQGWNLWPLKFVTRLFEEARNTSSKFDLRLHTRTPVTAIVPFSPSSTSLTPSANASSSSSSLRYRWTLSTPRGAVHCAAVLHATDGYAAHLLPHLADEIVPVRGQVIAVRGERVGKPAARESWVGGEGYWFPRPANSSEGDGEDAKRPLIILGGRRTAAGPPFEAGVSDDTVLNPAVGEALRGFLPAMFPGVYRNSSGGEGAEAEWTGIMAYTKLEIPFVGPVSAPSATEVTQSYEGQFIAAGYTGHGMPRAYGCAEAVVGMIAAEARGDSEAWVPPAWFPGPFLTGWRDRVSGRGSK
ncbi:FAD dependent oxidoreductase-domain-containing protein [Mycena polygramma]|nr:FAD dependent oxidoreductase-domain-containing protein [Mycena polygramma]